MSVLPLKFRGESILYGMVSVYVWFNRMGRYDPNSESVLGLTLASKLQRWCLHLKTAKYLMLALAVLLNTPSGIADDARLPVKRTRA